MNLWNVLLTVDAEALFGDADDISSDEEAGGKRKARKDGSGSEREQRSDDERRGSDVEREEHERSPRREEVHTLVCDRAFNPAKNTWFKIHFHSFNIFVLIPVEPL